MAAETGHHASRWYVDQDGNVHLNGASFYNDAETDIAGALEALGAAAAITLRGVTLSGATGECEITLVDNLADALSVKISGGADFLIFDSTNSNEKLTVLSAVTQKLGFYGTTPAVQPSGANQAAVTPSTDFSGADSVDKSVVLAAVQAVETLVNQLRSDLVTLGLIKGAA